MHPSDLAGGFSDLEMTWLFYCSGAATDVSEKDVMLGPMHSLVR